MVFSLKIYQIHTAVKQAGTLNATYPVSCQAKPDIIYFGLFKKTSFPHYPSH